MKSKTKNLLSTLLKIAITIALLYLVYKKVDFKNIRSIIKEFHKGFLVLSILCFLISQLISTERLQYLFSINNYEISRALNMKLYLLGMFYNFFIPGGIGGDAYKVYFLNKRYNWPLKATGAAILLDRIMGLIGILVLLIILVLFVYELWEISFFWIIFSLMILGLLISHVFVKHFFLSFIKGYAKGLILSILVQSFQCLTVFFILKGIADISLLDHIVYIIIFLISSVLSVFSFSGIGVREMIFYQAAVLFSFNTDIAVATGLLFSFITAVISFFGIIYTIKKI